MGIFNGIVLLILGGLCLPSLVAKKSPKAKELLDKIAVYQGILGLVVFFWGTWGLISSVTTIGWLGTWPLWWATRLAGNALNFAGGLILGFGMIQKMVLVKLPEEAQAKALELREKLVSFQTPIGMAALIAGVWVVVYELILQGILGI